MWYVVLTHPRGKDTMYFVSREEARLGAKWYRTMSDVTHTTTPKKV